MGVRTFSKEFRYEDSAVTRGCRKDLLWWDTPFCREDEVGVLNVFVVALDEMSYMSKVQAVLAVVDERASEK